MIIRDVRIDDHPEIDKLNRQLGYPLSSEKVKDRLGKIIYKTNDKIIVITDKDDSVIGYIHGTPYELMYCDSLVNILGLVVDNQYRGKGIGKKLVDEIETWAKKNEFSGIRINSGINRIESHEFYTRCGYVANKDQKRFFKSF